jgi:DNA-binding transcriptional LysR family regulator
MEDRLKKFAHLVDAGSFTKAAEEMHISQPALTAAIKKLERELHATLLVRSAPLRPTEAGKLAYETAKELAVATGNLSLKLTEQAHKKPSLAIGMIDSVADAFFGRSAGFDRLESQAKVSIVVNNSRYLAQAVLQNNLDVAFIAEQPHRPHETLAIKRVGTEPLIAVCHASVHNETVQAVGSGTLPRFIGYDQFSNTHQLIQQTFSKNRIRPKPLLYSTSPDIMLKFVLAQKGVAVLPYLLVKPYLGNHKLEPLAVGSSFVIERNIVAIRHRGKTLAASVAAAEDELRHTLNKLMAEANALS